MKRYIGTALHIMPFIKTLWVANDDEQSSIILSGKKGQVQNVSGALCELTMSMRHAG